jgi:hypothetical protein
MKTVKSSSGISMGLPDGKRKDLSYDDLLHLANKCRIEPEIHIAVEAEMAGREIDGAELSIIYGHLVETMTHGEWGRDHPGAADKFTEDDLSLKALCLLIMLQAANALRMESWMEPILIDSTSREDFLPWMARFFTTGHLVWSDCLEGIVFDREEAKAYFTLKGRDGGPVLQVLSGKRRRHVQKSVSFGAASST